MTTFLWIVCIFVAVYVIVVAVEFFKKMFYTFLDIIRANPIPSIIICLIIGFLIARLVYRLIIRVKKDHEYRESIRKLDIEKRVKSVENENAQNQLIHAKIKAVEDSYTPQTCPNCAAPISSGDRFCQYCGTKVMYKIKK